MLKANNLGVTAKPCRLFLAAMVCVTSTVAFVAQQANVKQATAAGAERILITGDSITQGSAGDYTWRYRLWKKLSQTAAGQFQLVGPRSDLYDNVAATYGSTAYAVPFSGSAHGAKWGGSFATDGAGITSMVAQVNPTVLVEMLESNDLAYQTNPSQTISAVRTYIARARAAKPGIDIVLCKVLTRWDPWNQTYLLTSETLQYATLLASLATELNTPAERVVIADTSNGWDPKTMAWDGTHPNPTGEALIAQRVSVALAQLGIGTAAPNVATAVTWDVPGPKPVVSAGVEKAVLSWNRSSTGATGMYIWQRLLTVPDQPWQQLPLAVSGDGWTSENLVPNGTYDFKLSPAKGFSSGVSGAAASTQVGSLPIGAIANLNVVPAVDTGGAAIANTTWSAASNATDYLLASKNESRSDSYSVLPYGVSDAKWTFVSLYPGNYYRFRVTPHRGFSSGSERPSSAIRMKGLTDHNAYAALGDSYSAGLGSEHPQESGPCLTSSAGWPGQLANSTLVDDFSLLACSGKTTAHVRDVQVEQMKSFFAAHPSKSKLVTMTIGGNDVHFSDELKKCVFGSCSGDESQIASDIDALESVLVNTYTQVRSAAPFADILVGGYPGLLEVQGGSLNAVCLGIGKSDERPMINRLATRLNSRIYSAAQSAGVWSVGQRVYNTFDGHNACSGEEWIHAGNFDVGGEEGYVLDAKTMHPNPVGQAYYALAFDSALKSYGD